MNAKSGPSMRPAACKVLFVISALFSGSAFACGGGALDIPMFVVAFGIVSVAISILTFCVLLVIRLFFNGTASEESRWPRILLVASVIATLSLGAFGSFALQGFGAFYASLGDELRTPTKVLFLIRHALWLPALVVLLLFCGANKRIHQTRFLTAFIGAIAILFGLVLWAAYLPVFVLGCM